MANRLGKFGYMLVGLLCSPSAFACSPSGVNEIASRELALMGASTHFATQCRIDIQVYGSSGLQKESCGKLIEKARRVEVVFAEITELEVAEDCRESDMSSEFREFFRLAKKYKRETNLIDELTS